MNPFNLPSGTHAKIIKVTPRKEQHGPELKQAVSLRMRHEGEGELLDLLAPGMRDAFLMVPPKHDGQEMLEGVPRIPTVLRVSGIEQEQKLAYKGSGYTLTIAHGIDDSTALELYTCTIDKVTAEAKNGGGCVVTWSVGSNRSITKELIGELCDLEGCEVDLAQVAPKPAEIDGTTAAFERDHPGQGDMLDPEDEDSEGGQTDATDAFVDAHAEG